MSKTALILSFIAFAFILTGPFAAPASAQEEQSQKLDDKRVDEAVKKGVEFLKTQQKPDGSWNGTTPLENIFSYGTTALCLFAVVKGGEPKNSPAVQNALKWLTEHEWKTIYDASTLVLALAALADEDEEAAPDNENADGKDLRTAPIPDPADGKKNLKRIKSNLSDLLKKALEYIVSNRNKDAVWRYPSEELGGRNDASNTQYACMAIFEARRIGYQVPNAIFTEIADYFIKYQQKDGPKIKGFSVPGADMNMADLLDLEKEWRKKFNKILEDEKKEAKKEGKEFKGVDLGTVPVENPPNSKFGAEGDFEARGWSYLPPDAPRTFQGHQVPTPMFDYTGSMTCSGVVCCMLSKLYLEKTTWYKENGRKLERAIRDGLGWLVQNWATDKNPGASQEDSWRYYYFYAVERAAVLSLVQKIGDHNWHYEIGNIILPEQMADGSWKGATAAPTPGGPRPAQHGPLWNTCFAILFLKKATTPIINEDVIYTGNGILKNAPKPEKEEPKKPAPEPEPPAPKGGEENPGK
jgi:hypothetical protein